MPAASSRWANCPARGKSGNSIPTLRALTCVNFHLPNGLPPNCCVCANRLLEQRRVLEKGDITFPDVEIDNHVTLLRELGRRGQERLFEVGVVLTGKVLGKQTVDVEAPGADRKVIGCLVDQANPKSIGCRERQSDRAEGI